MDFGQTFVGIASWESPALHLVAHSVFAECYVPVSVF